jgi:hypothetical protein
MFGGRRGSSLLLLGPTAEAVGAAGETTKFVLHQDYLEWDSTNPKQFPPGRL